MEYSEIKSLINTYYKAGQPEEVVADVLARLNMNGQMEYALEYLHTLYQNKNWHYGKSLSDTGNAERLKVIFGDKIHFCYARNKWLWYDGSRWVWDEGDIIMSYAKDVVKSIYQEASAESNDERRKQIVKFASVSESVSKRKAMIELAQAEPGIPVDIGEIDANKWLFNCLNGTLDLKTGKIHDHRKDDLLSIIVPINYEPDAKCDLWLKFLHRVTGDKPELVKYLQRAVGYSLTGDTTEQCLFFLYGLGRNGKSTFVGILRKLLGPYGHKTNTEMLMVRDRTGGPREDLADLKGKRLVIASEIEENKRLAIVLIKEMTGGESIRADRKHEHAFEFEPTHKIWLSGNHKPIITDTTYSIWRRFRLIPFTVTIPEEEKDPNLSYKLEKELPGILAWAVKGCLEWQRNGLREPEEVISATEVYRNEQDVLGEFIDDCCLVKSTYRISKNDLSKAYVEWCTENNQTPLGRTIFRGKIIERGIVEGKGTNGVREWRGITLKGNEVFETPELMADSGKSGKSGGKNHYIFTTNPREEGKPENYATNATNATINRHEQQEYDVYTAVIQKQEEEPF